MTNLNKRKLCFIATLLCSMFAVTAQADSEHSGPKLLESVAPEAVPSSDVVPLPKALDIAQLKTEALVIEAEIKKNLGKGVYAIKLVNKQGKEFGALISSDTGDVLLINDAAEKDQEKLLKNIFMANKLKSGSIRPLASVIEQAEQYQRARVYDAKLEFELDDDSRQPKLTYHLKLIDASGVKVSLKIPA